jgi:hypothetical protein
LIQNALRLTVRDIEVMNDIYDNQFLSFYQIHEKHFPENKRPTVYNRLSKLIRGDVLEAINVNLLAHHRRGELLGVIYRLTKDGLRRLQDFKMTMEINLIPASMNFSNLYHDLLLTDVLRVLNRNWKVTNAPLGIQDRIPDAVLIHPVTGSKMALELELTAKSEMRYRDIILSYRTSSEFETVLYVVKDKSIQRKLGALITGFNSRFELSDDTDKFKFLTLDDLFNASRGGGNELQA